MGRQSYASKAQQLKRADDPVAGLAWRAAAFEAIANTDVTEIRVGDPICIDNGWTDQHLRKMCQGSGGLGLLNMRADFDDVEPTPHSPAGKRFREYVWEVRK